LWFDFCGDVNKYISERCLKGGGLNANRLKLSNPAHAPPPHVKFSYLRGGHTKFVVTQSAQRCLFLPVPWHYPVEDCRFSTHVKRARAAHLLCTHHLLFRGHGLDPVLLAGDELHDRLEAFRRQNSGGAASGQGRIVVKPQLQVRPPVIICRRIRPWLLSQSGRMVVRKCSFPLSRLRSFMHSVVSQFWTNSLRTDILHPTDTNFFHPNLIISPPATSVYFPKYINPSLPGPTPHANQVDL